MKAQPRVRQSASEAQPELGLARKLHVCVLAPFPPFLSGVGDYTRDLVSALRASARVTVISHRVVGALDEETVGDLRILRTWEPQRLLAPVRLYRTIRRIQPDIVHIQFGLYGREFGGVLGEPVLLLLALLRKAGIPTVVTLHSLWPREEIRKRIMDRFSSPTLAKLAEAYGTCIYRWIARLPRRLMVSVSPFDFDAATKFALEYQLSPTCVTSIPHGVPAHHEVRRTDARLALGLQPAGPVFLAFGFIYEDKGTDLAIRALGPVSARLGGATLVVVGPLLPGRGAGYLTRLEHEVAQLPASATVLLRPGYVDESKAALYFAAADAVVIPYRRIVGTSGVLHRAIAAGRASIASDATWHRLDGAGTLVVPAEDVASLAGAMIQVGSDQGLRDRLEDEARLAAQAQQWSTAAQRNLQVYNEVYAASKRGAGDGSGG